MKTTLKILLVNPTRVGADSYSTPPLHLMYLKTAFAGVAGISCEIFDASYQTIRKLGVARNLFGEVLLNKKHEIEEELIREICSKDFDILGIGGIVPCFHFAERVAVAAAKVRPEAWIVVGGGLGLPLKELWAGMPVHFLVEGDGEISFSQVVQAYPDPQKARAVRGVHSRDNGSWKGSAPELPANLDYIGFPDWDDVDHAYFIDIMREWMFVAMPQEFHPELRNARLLPVVFSRGCSYQCTFCFHFNRLHRKHSVEYVIRHLKHLKEKYGINMVNTWDELIVADRRWFLKLCQALKEENLGIRLFMAGGKPNLIDREMVQAMKEAGVVRISYGTESGSPRMLKIMKKMVTVEENREAVKISMAGGVFTHLNMVIGMPGENEGTLAETRGFLLQLQKEAGISSQNVSFAFATAYPGTELFDQAVKAGLVKDLRSYVMECRGVVSYYLDLCGMGERRLWRFIDGIQIEMNFHEYLKKFKWNKLSSLMFVRIPKFMVKYYLPESWGKYLRRKLGR